MSKKEIVFKSTFPILIGVIALLIATLPVATARPPLGVSNFDAIHLNCNDCATATPVFMVNRTSQSGSGNIIEVQALATPVFRFGQTGAQGDVNVPTITVSGSTITPTRNIAPLSSTTAQTISAIVTANLPGLSELVIYNTVTTNTVVSETATLQLAGNVTLGQYDTLRLIYDSNLGAWVEVSRSNN